jgi:hypothetical protein
MRTFPRKYLKHLIECVSLRESALPNAVARVSRMDTEMQLLRWIFRSAPGQERFVKPFNFKGMNFGQLNRHSFADIVRNSQPLVLQNKPSTSPPMNKTIHEHKADCQGPRYEHCSEQHDTKQSWKRDGNA